MEIDYLPITDFGCLDGDWRRLEQGQEMSYFQTYDWYSSILPAIPKDCKYYESRFVVLKEDGRIKIIAPIWVVKQDFYKVNEAGVFLLGRSGWSDYLNFIYSEATEEDFSLLLTNIANHYDVHSFYFEDVPESSALVKAIHKSYKVTYSQKGICVAVHFHSTPWDYQTAISKNAKKRLRVVENRIQKGNIDVSFVFDDSLVNKKKCEKMRAARLELKKSGLEFWQSFKLKFFNLFRVKFSYEIPFYVDKNSHIMSVYFNGELAAFFNYGIDRYHKKIVIMAVGTSQKFAWYSPGLLLGYNYILEQSKGNEINVVDFTRGDERYKYSLGGQEHFNLNIKFTV